MANKKSYLSLQPSEGMVFRAAANIYSAYIASGRVAEGDEASWMERSIREAIKMAKATDLALVSDDELDA